MQLEARASEVSLSGPGSCVTPLASEATSALSVPDTSLQEAAEVRERLESVQVWNHSLNNALGRHQVYKKRTTLLLNIYMFDFNIILLQAEKDKLEGDVSRLEEELSIIAVASRTLTACTVIPVIGQ